MYIQSSEELGCSSHPYGVVFAVGFVSPLMPLPFLLTIALPATYSIGVIRGILVCAVCAMYTEIRGSCDHRHGSHVKLLFVAAVALASAYLDGAVDRPIS